MSNLLIFPLIERAKRTAHKRTTLVRFPHHPNRRNAILAKLRADDDAREVTRESR